MKIIAKNKRAHLDYDILDKWEAGVILTGAEVKSAKAGQINLKGGYVTIHGSSLSLINVHISPYQKASHAQKKNDPTRSRRLLLKKSEIKKVMGRLGGANSGLTLVPLSVYNKKGFLKVEVGLGKGRKKADKREYIKNKETNLRIRKALRGKNRLK